MTKEPEVPTDEQLAIAQKQIDMAIAGLDKKFGKGSVIKMDSDPQQWPSVSTGALTVDIALGIGGLPKGRIIELFGGESSGKTTMALSVIANAQRQGGRCLFIDAEHALDPVYAKALGVDIESLHLAQPSAGEEAVDILETMVKTGAISVAVIDSVAALVPRAELEGDMDTQHMGLQPRLMAKTMRKMTGLASDTGTLIIFINQIREKVGIVFGNPEITPGGRALKFHASVRLQLLKKSNLTNSNGEIVGSEVEAKILKNKMAPPLKRARFDVEYGKGINTAGCLLDLAVERGFAKKAGAWYSYGNENLGQGRDNSISFIREHPEIQEILHKEIMASV